MTDEELKELVASLAIDQKELTKKMAQTEEQMRETDRQIKFNHAQLQEQMKHTDEQMRETDRQIKFNHAQLQEQMKLTDEQMKHTDEQMKRNDEKLTRMGIMLGNITQNQGDVAEEFFFNSLIRNCHLGQIYFDDVTQSMKKHRGKIQEEYDLFLSNGDAIAIVEVKYKAHENDLEKLDRKMRHFKKLFPIYASFKQYGALASFHINEKAKEEALRRGYFVLQRCGDLIHTETGEHLTVL